MRVAIYCRVSSAGQEDNSSLDTQERSCRAYAAERGWVVAHIYREVHTGAELFERPQLTALREAMRRGTFDVLLVHALDRLSRKQTHQGLILSEAEHAGVTWDSVTEDIDDSPQGQILRAVIGGMAEMERLKLAERTVRGRLARVQAGKLIPGGKPPYGYRWRDTTKCALDLDPITAPIARSVFERIAAGGTLHSVVRDLQADGTPTSTGRGAWHAQTIRDMLLKPLYCGRAYAWGWKKRTPGNPQQFDPEKAIALPPGTVPAIVSEETWQAAQGRMTLNRQRAIRSAKNPETALLRGGYVACGRCGRTVRARPRTNGKVEYVCSRGRSIGDCAGCCIAGHRLDDAVWARVSAILTNPAVIAREVARLRQSDPTAADLGTIDRALREIERQQANLARTIGQLDDVEAAAPLTAQLLSLNQRRTSLLAERDSVRERHASWAASQSALDSLSMWCKSVATNVEAMTWTEKRLTMDALGVRVTLYPDQHEPRYVITADVPLDVVSRTT